MFNSRGEGEEEGWEIIYGLDSGKCLVFLDIFTFITRASMIYHVSLSELIKSQTFCHYVYPAFRDEPHIYLRVNAGHHPTWHCLSPRILDLLAGPGAGDDDGGAPQSVPGRVWVACVIPSVLSQSEASTVTRDQSEACKDPCHPITRHTATWEHKNNLPSTTNRFGQYLFLPKSVKSLRL